MAIRTVLLRFTSNANAFASDMERVSAATKSVQAAGVDLANAQRAQATAAQDVATADMRMKAEKQALIATEAQAKVALDVLNNAEEQAIELRRIGLAQGAELADATAASAKSQIASLSGLAVQQREQYTERIAEVDALKAAEASLAEETAAAAATQKGAAEQQAAARSALMGKVGNVAMLGGAAIAFGFYEATKAAVEFDSKMNDVAAISSITRNNLQEMSDQVITLSKGLPSSANEFAEALVAVEQAGYHGVTAINLLRTAAEGAEIGFTTVGAAAGDIVKILNGFELGASQAANVNNLLVASVTNGIGSYHQFGDALAQMGPIAKAAGISVNDVAGAITAMSTKGIQATGAGMGLLRMIFNMGKEGSAGEKILLSLVNTVGKIPITTGAAALSTLGLGGVIELLGKQTGGTLGAIERLFPSVRQAKAAMSLLSDGGAAAGAMIAKFNDQQKLAEDEARQWAVAQGSAANQMKIAENQIKAVGISLGQSLIPALTGAVKFIAGLISAFQGLNDMTQGWAGKIALAGAAAAVAFGIISKVAPVVKAMSAAFAADTVVKQTLTVVDGELVMAEEEVAVATATSSAVIEASLGPIGWAALAIGALVAAFGLYEAGSSGAVDSTNDFIQAMKEEQAGTTGATATLILHQMAQDGLIDKYSAVGISSRDVTQSIMDGSSATQAHVDMTNRLIGALGLSDDALQKSKVSSQDIAEIHGLVARAVSGDTSATEDLKNKVSQLNAERNVSTAVSRKGVQIDLQHMDLLENLANKTSGFIGAQKEQALTKDQLTQQTIAYNKSLTDGVPLLETVDSSVSALTDSEKQLQNTMKGWVDVTSVVNDASKNTIDSLAVFSSSVDVFKDLFAQSKQDLTDEAQAMSDANNKRLEDSTQAAQDAATETEKINSDYLSAVKGVNADVDAAMKDRAKKSDDAAKAAAKSIERANSDAKTSAKDFAKSLGDPKVALDNYLDGLDKTAAATLDWRNDLETIAQKGGSQALIEDLRKLGKDGVPLVKEFADGTIEQIDRANAAEETLASKADVSFDEYEKTLADHMYRARVFQNNLAQLTLIAPHVAEQMLEESAKDPEKGAELTADALKQTPAQLADAETKALAAKDFTNDADVQTFQRKVVALMTQIGNDGGKATMDALKTQLASQGFDGLDVSTFADQFRTQILAEFPSLADILFPQVDKELSDQANHALATDKGDPVVNTGNPAPSRPRFGPSANGNIFRFADGAENHVAQIAAANWRVWAEPETGGEAYIPLSPSKRGRSTGILQAVASEFGYGLHKKGEMMSPVGSQLTGTSGNAGGSTVTHVVVKQPVSKTTEYKFTGPIQGYRLEQVTADAERKSRLAALSGGG